MDKARGGARTALAIASLVEQKAKYKFTTEDIEELTSKADAARCSRPAAFMTTFLLPFFRRHQPYPFRKQLIYNSQLLPSQLHFHSQKNAGC